MITFICALLFLALSLTAVSLRKTYLLHPATELKRRARRNDAVAAQLYQAVAYGVSLQSLLWIVIVGGLAVSFLLLALSAPWPLVLLTEAVVIAYAFAWSPTTRTTHFGVRLALLVTPAVNWLLKRTDSVLRRLIRPFDRAHRPHLHTGLYERDDLLALIERQRGQPDSRLPQETLELLVSVLHFGDKLVRDCMIPRRQVHAVSSDEPIGPMLMRTLHESGQTCFPVYAGDNHEALAGTVSLFELVSLKHTGIIADIADRHLAYVHEEYPLEQVLDAFYKTHQHMFVVVDEHDEYVGVITVEKILEQIIGYRLEDEFDQYDSRQAVAAHHRRRAHRPHAAKDKVVVPEQASPPANADDEKTAEPDETVVK